MPGQAVADFGQRKPELLRRTDVLHQRHRLGRVVAVAVAQAPRDQPLLFIEAQRPRLRPERRPVLRISMEKSFIKIA